MLWTTRLAALTATLLVAACGTGSTAPAGPGGAGSSVVVQLSPTTATVEPDGELQIAATVTGTADPGLTWTIAEGTTGGTVTGGKYKAPSAEGLYHVVATSTADPTRSASTTISSSRRRISVSPATAAIFGCQTATFTAKVTGGGDGTASWSVQEGAAGGTITAAGVYTAPQAAGTYHVVAVSHADPTKSATAAVTVTTQVLSVSMASDAVALAAGGTGRLGATVVTTCGTFPTP